MSELLDEVLSEKELERITGYKKPHYQKLWLQKRAWIFDINAASHPIVHRSMMREKLGVETFPKDKKKKWDLDKSKVG